MNVGYQIAPGACFSCKNPESDRLNIDLEMDDLSEVRRHRVYVCADCVHAAAQLLSDAGAPFIVVDREAYDALHTAKTEADAAVERLAVLAGQVDDIRELARQIAGTG